MDKKTRFRFFGFEYLERHVQIAIGLIVLFVLNLFVYIVASIGCFLYYNNGVDENASALSNVLVDIATGILPYEIIIVSAGVFIGLIACAVVGINKKKNRE